MKTIHMSKAVDETEESLMDLRDEFLILVQQA